MKQSFVERLVFIFTEVRKYLLRFHLSRMHSLLSFPTNGLFSGGYSDFLIGFQEVPLKGLPETSFLLSLPYVVPKGSKEQSSTASFSPCGYSEESGSLASLTSITDISDLTPAHFSLYLLLTLALSSANSHIFLQQYYTTCIFSKYPGLPRRPQW